VLLWTIFEDIRREKAKFLKIYMDSFEEMYVHIKYSLQKEDSNMRKCAPHR
jgi:hypothetical protein